MRSIVWQKEFLILLVSTLVSGIGTGTTLIAVDWYLLEASGSRAIALLFSFSLLTNFFSLPWIATMFDRFNRKWVLATFIFAGAVLQLMVFLGLGLPPEGEASIQHLVLFLGLSGLCSSLIRGADQIGRTVLSRDLFTPEFYDQINRWLETLRQAITFISGAIGVLLLEKVALRWIILFDVITYFLAFVMILKLPSPKAQNTNPIKPRAEWREALAFFKNNTQTCIKLMALAMPFAIILALNVIYPSHFKNVLKAGPTEFAFLSLPYGAGAIAAAIFHKRCLSPEDWRIYLFAIFALALLVVGLIPITPMTYALAFTFAFAHSFLRIERMTLLMRKTPSALLGRITGAIEMFSLAITLVGAHYAGNLADEISVVASWLLLLSLPALDSGYIIFRQRKNIMLKATCMLLILSINAMGAQQVFSKVAKIRVPRLVPVYSTLDLTFTEGQGVYLRSSANQDYLDGVSGTGVTALGHKHPVLTNAATKALSFPTHPSNRFQYPERNALAKALSELAGMDEVYFSNSGAEANDTAMKIAAAFGAKKGIRKGKIIVMTEALHGRSLAGTFASDIAGAGEIFGDWCRDLFVRVPFDDISAIEAKIAEDKDIVAILVEPVQGKGGIRIPSPSYLEELSHICDEADILLMLDEVQTGIGRTGKWFAFQHSSILPDVLILAKSLGGGVLPIGATLVGKKALGVLTTGSHGSTVGGGSPACAVSLALVDEIKKNRLVEHAQSMGIYLLKKLHAALHDEPRIKEIRGIGLMIGVELAEKIDGFAELALEQGLLIDTTHNNVIRILPPLIISESECDDLVDRLARTFKQST